MNRPEKLYRSLAKSDEELSSQFIDQNYKARDTMAFDIFNKSYDSISAYELHEFVEELIASLFVLRNNMPTNFNLLVRLVAEHKNIGIIDRNVSL